MIQEKKKHKKSKKKPSAMAQVHNRVNAGVMDGVVYGGMMEAAEPEDEEYEIGMEEEGGPSNYAHVVEGRKTMFITEEQLKQIKLLLEGDDRIKKVNKMMDAAFGSTLNLDSVVSGPEYYVNGDQETTWRKYILFSLRHTFGLMTNADVQYLPVVARLAFSDEVGFEKRNNNGAEILKLQKIVSYLKKDSALFNELKSNPSITFGDLCKRLDPVFKEQDSNELETANNVEVRSDYEIKWVPDFKTAKYYGDRSCSESKLCYTQEEDTWESYTNRGENKVYVCLKNGWENIPEKWGPNNPYDEYGTSMIFVFINPFGELVCSNCRWNHHISPRGSYNGDTDHAFTKATLSQTVGVRYSDVFKPYTADELKAKGLTAIDFVSIKRALETDVPLTEIFDNCIPVKNSDDTFLVLVHTGRPSYNEWDGEPVYPGRWNVVKGRKLLFDEWFKTAPKVFNVSDTLIFMLEREEWTYNLATENGQYLSNSWFRGAERPEYLDGLKAFIVRNEGGEKNLLKLSGGLLSPKWFSDIESAGNEAPVVKVYSEMPGYTWALINLMDRNGRFVSKTWFSEMSNLSEGYVAVENINGESNLMDMNGEFISKDWFDYCGIFKGGLAKVRNKESQINFISHDGRFISDQWFSTTNSIKTDFGRVIIVRLDDGKISFINPKNVFINKWFDELSNFQSGWFYVGLNGKRNYVNLNGELLSKYWFYVFYWSASEDVKYAIGEIEPGKWNAVDITTRELVSKDGFDTLGDMNRALQKMPSESLSESIETSEPGDEEHEIEMDENDYAHVVNEATDVIPFLNIDLYDSDAYPFITFKKLDGSDTRTFVGVAGEQHNTMPASLLSNGDIKRSDFKSQWDITRNEYKSGRIWFTNDRIVVSFYSYHKDDYSRMYNDILGCLIAIQDKMGVSFNPGEVMIDFWTFVRGHDDIFVPLRWLRSDNDVTIKYFPHMIQCLPIENGYYKLVTDDNQKHILNWKGDDVILKEEKEMSKKVDYDKYIKSLIEFMREQHLRIDPLPEIELNPEEQDCIFIKTGYYSPDEKKVVVFTDGRHPKDILRTVAHEFVHHMQNLQNPNKDWGTGGDLEADRKLRDIEGEAFLLGNIIFREWTEKMKKAKELNESITKESPDYISTFGVRYRDEDAIPFMLYRKNGKFYVGNNSGIHTDMMKKLGVTDDVLARMDDDVFDEIVDSERSGRYWTDNNVISFWKTPLDNKTKLIDTVSRLSLKVGMDLKNLVVDYWEGPTDMLIPYRWFCNGTLDMFLGQGIRYVNPEDETEYYRTGSWTNFRVETLDGHRYTVDVDGNPQQSQQYQYSYGLNESIDCKKALKNLKKRRDPNNIENWDRIDEIESEIIEPDDVDLSSFNIKRHLNPKFWDDGHLDTRIRLKLLDIADDFFNSLDVDWVEPEDIIITGSLANYNWDKKYSDIDLHILVDYEDVDERVDFVREYFTMKKNEWNQKHKNLKIFGFPVEVYVQDSSEPHASSGVYSIDKDKWLTEPDLEKLRSGKVDKRHVREMVSTYMNKIDCLIDIYKKHKDDEYEMKKVAKDASETFDEIKSLRKDDLAKYGREMCDGNLIFKALRRSDYIAKLIKLKNLTYDKINSL